MKQKKKEKGGCGAAGKPEEKKQTPAVAEGKGAEKPTNTQTDSKHKVIDKTKAEKMKQKHREKKRKQNELKKAAGAPEVQTGKKNDRMIDKKNEPQQPAGASSAQTEKKVDKVIDKKKSAKAIEKKKAERLKFKEREKKRKQLAKAAAEASEAKGGSGVGRGEGEGGKAKGQKGERTPPKDRVKNKTGSQTPAGSKRAAPEVSKQEKRENKKAKPNHEKKAKPNHDQSAAKKEKTQKQQPPAEKKDKKEPSEKTEKKAVKKPKLSPAEQRLADFRARTINDEIAQHANRRELAEARRCYGEAVKDKIANGHTFTITVNAFVRCGDNEGAAKVISDMEVYGLAPCVITYTTLINGLCKAGDISAAFKVVRDMTARKPPVLPNIRTVNTLLRGCMLVGSTSAAEALFLRAQQAWKLKPDASTYEYTLTLLCQALRLHRASVLLDQLKERIALQAKQLPDAAPDPAADAAKSAQVCVCMARAAAVLKDKPMYRAASRQAREALKEDGQKEGGKDGAGGGEEGKARGSEGGKRGWRVTGEEREAAASKFETHRREELGRELQMIEGYAERMFGKEEARPTKKKRARKEGGAEETPTGKAGKKETEEEEEEEGEREDGESVSSCLLRVVSLDLGVASVGELLGVSAQRERRAHKEGKGGGGKKGKGSGKEGEVEEEKDGKGDEDEKEGGPRGEVVERLLGALRERFGLEEVLCKEEEEAEPSGGGAGKGGAKAKSGGGQGGEETARRLAEFRARLRRQVDKSGRLKLGEVFGNSRPVRLEIASGAGEWAAAQAAAEEGAANWATLELRHDRVYQGFSRAVFQGLTNLAVMGGDALRILPNHIPPSSISAIFVNHPEPPQQTGGADAKSQGFHLLSREFFIDMHRALEDGGMLTIVTDNRWYAMLLLKIVAALNNAGVRFKSKKLSEGSRVHSEGGVHLYQGSPGPECGHVVKASSYFDRLWQKGINRHAETTNRFFLCIVRLE